MMLVALPDKEDLRNRREADLAGFGWSRSHRRFGSEGVVRVRHDIPGFPHCLLFHKSFTKFHKPHMENECFLNIRCVEGVIATAGACGRTRADLRSRGDQRVMCAGFTRE